MELPRDDVRLSRKRQLLGFFESEGGERLVQLFGRRDRYRRIADPRRALLERPRGYARVGGRYLGISVLCLWIFALEIGFSVIYFASRGFVQASGGPLWRGAFVSLGLLGIVYALARRQETVEWRAIFLACAAGFLMSAH